MNSGTRPFPLFKIQICGVSYEYNVLVLYGVATSKVTCACISCEHGTSTVPAGVVARLLLSYLCVSVCDVMSDDLRQATATAKFVSYAKFPVWLLVWPKIQLVCEKLIFGHHTSVENNSRIYQSQHGCGSIDYDIIDGR